MATPIINNNFQVTDSQNRPLAGGRVYTYEPYTTTPKTTYSDSAETSPNPNPLTLDPAGSAMIYGTGAYKIDVKDMFGSQVPGWPKEIDIIDKGDAATFSIIKDVFYVNNSPEITDHGIESGDNYNKGNIHKAIDTIGSAPATMIFPDGTYNLGGNHITIPDNIEVKAGPAFNPVNGTLEVLGPHNELTVNTVADLKKINGGFINQAVKVLGYHKAGDGGGARYKVVAGGTGSTIDYINLKNGLQAKLIYGKTLKPRQFGAHGNGIDDDREILQSVFDLMQDNMILDGEGGEYGYSLTTISLAHTTSSGANTRDYNAALVLKNLKNIALNIKFKEILDPTALTKYYQLCLVQNVINSDFKVAFEGHSSLKLTNEMTTGTNPLDTKGAEVVVFLDSCRNNEINGKCLQARVLYDIRCYDPVSYKFFTPETRPYGFTGKIKSIDSKYGFRNEGGNHTIIEVSAENNKRSYRLDGGINHVGTVHAYNKETWSWDSDSYDIYLQAGVLPLGNVKVDVNLENRPTLVMLRTLDTTALIQNIRLNLNMRSGRLVLANATDSADAWAMIKDVAVTGTIYTDKKIPVRLYPRMNVGDVNSRIRRLSLTDLNIVTTDGVDDFVRIEKVAGSNVNHLEHITLNNVTMVGTSDGNNQESDNVNYKNGEMVLRNVKGLTLSNVSHLVNGLSSSDNTINFIKCVAPAVANTMTPGVIFRDDCTLIDSDFPTQTEIIGPVRFYASGQQNQSFISIIPDGNVSTIRMGDEFGTTIVLDPRKGLRLTEMTDPAGVAGHGILYTRDNGAGKTELCVRFGSDVVVLATES